MVANLFKVSQTSFEKFDFECHQKTHHHTSCYATSFEIVLSTSCVEANLLTHSLNLLSLTNPLILIFFEKVFETWVMCSQVTKLLEDVAKFGELRL